MSSRDAAADRIEELETLLETPTKEEIALRLRIVKLEAALRFYACDGHWMLNGQCDPNSSRFEGPNVARAALDKDISE